MATPVDPVVYHLALATACAADGPEGALESIGACFGRACGSTQHDPVARFKVTIQPGGADGEVAMRALLEWCHTLVVKYEELGTRDAIIRLVVREADVDTTRLAVLNHTTRIWTRPIAYLGGTERHAVVTVADRLAVLKAHTACAQWIRETLPQLEPDARDPAQRAEYIYYQMVYLCRAYGHVAIAI